MAVTRAPKTIIVQSINGATEFDIPFEFLARKFVVITLLGADRVELVLNRDYRFVSTARIQLLIGTAGYEKIELRRLTSASDRLVVFVDGSILRSHDINLAQVQTIHIAEEARDLTADNIGVNDNGDLDARNRKIVNLSPATDPMDAVNLGQLKEFDNSTFNNAQRAEASRVAAEAARDAARISETNAGNHAVYARDRANEADASKLAAQASATIASEGATVATQQAGIATQRATEAAQSAFAAGSQADRAKVEADRAEAEADKLQNWNALAGTVDSVDTTTKRVFWKSGHTFQSGDVQVAGGDLWIDAPTSNNITALNMRNANDYTKFAGMYIEHDAKLLKLFNKLDSAAQWEYEFHSNGTAIANSWRAKGNIRSDDWIRAAGNVITDGQFQMYSGGVHKMSIWYDGNHIRLNDVGNSWVFLNTGMFESRGFNSFVPNTGDGSWNNSQYVVTAQTGAWARIGFHIQGIVAGFFALNPDGRFYFMNADGGGKLDVVCGNVDGSGIYDYGQRVYSPNNQPHHLVPRNYAHLHHAFNGNQDSGDFNIGDWSSYDEIRIYSTGDGDNHIAIDSYNRNEWAAMQDASNWVVGGQGTFNIVRACGRSWVITSVPWGHYLLQQRSNNCRIRRIEMIRYW